MTEYQPMTGDRVRVVIEGEVKSTAYSATRPGFYLWADGHDREGFIPSRAATVERLVDPLTFLPLQPGDVVQASGTTYFVSSDGVRIARDGSVSSHGGTTEQFADWLNGWHHRHPGLTCALLVRNGKTVSP